MLVSLLPGAMLLAVLASPAPKPRPVPTVVAASAGPTPSPQRILGLIRARFRSHRPPPPFEIYTVERKQLATNGYPDLANSYSYHVWVRNLDRAALARQIFRDDYRGPLTFQRPAFNEDRDPGPPTADLFEPAPLKPRPVEFVPTPEPLQTQLPLIGTTVTAGEYEYNVVSVVTEGSELHVTLEPIRDPMRNRLRELWVDKQTYELHKLVATDRLFYGNKQIFPVTFTVKLGLVDGHPVVTDIHGVVGAGYDDDGKEVDFTFRDISFPATLPAWYFDPHTYAAHGNDAPT
ncbi:MAG TPA: hypothetical protein VMA36_10860 [Candidatus Limnocylindria bacterium]|jgi:hypothetical protein|nr:hypothetical protein [Candidatus Limnocylindria bacterium]